MATTIANDTACRLRPATDRDWAMVRKWLRLAEVERWMGPASSTEAEVIQALGGAHSLACIIEHQGQPIGYAHAVDAMTWGEELPQDLQPGTWDMDLFIAAPSARGLGFGARALAALRNEVFSTTLATAVCVFTSIRNEHAVRAYEKSGFEWRRIWHDPINGPVWLLVAERPT